MKKLSSILLLSILSTPALSTTYNVCNEPGFNIPSQRFSILKNVIENQSNDGDIVNICSTDITFTDKIYVDRDITITGSGPTTNLTASNNFMSYLETPVNKPEKVMLELRSSGITLQNVRIDGNNKATIGVKVQSYLNAIRIQDNYITRLKGYGDTSNANLLKPARAIFFKQGSINGVIQRNNISEISGIETSNDKHLEAKGSVAHRAIYARSPSNLVIYRNTINDVYGYLDGDAIHILNMPINGNCPAKRTLISQNTINEFGKRGIKIQGGTVEVVNNYIYSKGARHTSDGIIDSNEMGIPIAGIAPLSTSCISNFTIRNNIVDMERASAGILIQSNANYYNNTIKVRQSASGRGTQISSGIKSTISDPANSSGNNVSHPVNPFCWAKNGDHFNCH